MPDASIDRGPERRATLRLTTRCNNACIFCAQRGLAQAPDLELPEIAAALRVLRGQSNELTFIGGEPALSPALEAAIAEARAQGFTRIGLQTNGAALAAPEAAGALAEAGLTDIHLSLHGADPAVHDYHTGRPGSFLRAMAALRSARGARLGVAVTTVVTRSSYRVLSELPMMLRQRGVSAWCLAFPRVAGAALAAFDRVSPRLGMAMPFALHAVEGARRLGLPTWLRDAPACLLGPYAPFLLETSPLGYAAPCDGCAARERCPGVEPRYTERFGAQELSPAAKALPRDEGMVPLRRMFVGVGEEVRPPPPSARSLPVLG